MFERVRVPFRFRVLGLAMYFQGLGGLLRCCLNTVGFLRRLFVKLRERLSVASRGRRGVL